MVFVNKLAKIVEVVKGFVDSIVAIASGAIDAAATRVENTLAGLLALAINFLAGFAGLGKVADKVMEVINKIRAPIDKALDWLVNWIVKMAKTLFAKGKAAVGKILGWWSEKLGFTNEAGETHTLQFIGEGESAKLGIATTLTSVEVFLKNHPATGTPKWIAAQAAYKSAESIMFSPAAKKADEKDRRKKVKDELAKVSKAFAELGGQPPKPAEYGKSTAPVYTGLKPMVEVIVDAPDAGGSRTGKWPEKRPGYKEIHEADLTTATDPWVQMHIISEKLGGKGNEFENLVPAPQSVNLGPFRSFEHAAAKLSTGKTTGPNPIKNRVWVEVEVLGDKTTATGLVGRAGLYFWRGTQFKPKLWEKNETPSLTVNAAIPAPQLQKGKRKLVLNFTSGTEMTRDFGIASPTPRLVKEGRPYTSDGQFRANMKSRGASDTQVDSVLKHKPVLDGP
jgi:hypothetical protein